MTAAAAKLNFDSTKSSERVDKREISKWQIQAWRLFDAIGELHYSFGMIGSIVSRVRIFPAIVTDPSVAPAKIDLIIEKLDLEGLTAEQLSNAAQVAQQAIDDLLGTASGGQSGFLREAAINLAVPGEFYLVNAGTSADDPSWIVASSEELVKRGDSYAIKTDRSGRSSEKPLPKNAFVARIWRSHPRFSGEPDSTMLGVLDQAEKLVLFDQAMRTILRTRMNAGIVFIPDGLVAASGDEESDVEAAITEVVSRTVEDESAAHTIVPLVISGPAEAGKAIVRISLARELEEALIQMADTALDRVLQGIDMPKDIVTGLSDVKYANGIVIDDSLFTSHIEPLVLMLVDAITAVYLKPVLEKAGIPDELIKKIVVWYDPSEIVTRPDRSTAANEGWDRKLLSGDTWRRARGFSETDAPDSDELILRLALEKAQVPPDMAAQLIESINPDFWTQIRAGAQAQSGMSDDLTALLSGEPTGEPPGPEPAEGPMGTGEEPVTQSEGFAGGELSPNGMTAPV